MNIQKLSFELIVPLAQAFECWPKERALFEQYFKEQKNDERSVWVALENGLPIGYVTLKWRSAYQLFKENNIPEINDLNVLPAYRNQGIGSSLLDVAEKSAFGRGKAVGLGVGLYADYGSAQKLYMHRGYIPDGRGITYNYEYVVPGSSIVVDDELILWLIKKHTI